MMNKGKPHQALISAHGIYNLFRNLYLESGCTANNKGSIKSQQLLLLRHYLLHEIPRSPVFSIWQLVEHQRAWHQYKTKDINLNTISIFYF